jgi:hypothetical protein
VVQDGITLVKSKETGLYYATAKKASIPCTFDEATCKSLIGKELDGTVEKIDCEPYEFINEETGEVIQLDHRWVFVKTGDSVAQAVKAEENQPKFELV